MRAHDTRGRPWHSSTRFLVRTGVYNLIVLNLDMDPAVPWWASSGNAREPVRLNAGKHGTRGHLGGNTRKFAAKQGSHP